MVLPHVTIHCFPADTAGAGAFERFAADRRLARATVEVVPGGIDVAVNRYGRVGTPNLLVIESTTDADTLLFELDRLAEVCEPTTQVVVIGRVNDIGLYRALKDRQVADYLLSPFDPLALVAVAMRLFTGEDAGTPIGRVFSFIAAKGGVGSSTIAHNVAWSMAQAQRADTLLLDLDIAFGASSIAFNVEAARGSGDALRDVARLDAALLERLMTRRGEHLCLMTAPASLDFFEEPSEATVEKILDVTRRAMPFVVVDLPHHWNQWVRTVLTRSDGVVIVTAPTLASMRNAAHLVEVLKTLRPNDRPPRLILNHLGSARHSELSRRDISETLGLTVDYELEHEPKLFGTADAEGALIAEGAGNRRMREHFAAIAQDLAGRNDRQRAAAPKRGWSLSRLFGGKRAGAG